MRISEGLIGIVVGCQTEGEISLAQKVPNQHGGNRDQNDWRGKVVAGGKLLSTEPFIGSLIILWGLLMAVILTGCPREMAEQPSFEPYEAPLLTPPASSVPTYGKAGKMKDPVPSIAATANSIEEGSYLYQIYCAMCHGEKGQGDGAASKKYYPKLADLRSSRVQQLADKEIFTRITNGFRTMPSFKKDLASQERWHIINYLRTLGQG